MHRSKEHLRSLCSGLYETIQSVLATRSKAATLPVTRLHTRQSSLMRTFARKPFTGKKTFSHPNTTSVVTVLKWSGASEVLSVRLLQRIGYLVRGIRPSFR